ncbi:MAG: hypothetical protein A2234_09910 [Elusimicrobia bacterium RIFOXYA2_FULL_58_8]|nr:MAG: hypothetical protein A2234_09910 [Elusimicrobia bacterium RIFOXYA2_FULL_58_8]
MKKAGAVLLLLSLPALSAAAGGLPGVPQPGYVAGYFSAGLGSALPFGGHWGDADSGFKPSPALNLSLAKRIDELLSYGIDSVHAWRHENRAAGGLDLKITSLTPFVKVSVAEGDRLYYGLMGLGLYRWSYPSFIAAGTVYSSDAAWNAGFNFGAGILLPFPGNSRAGLELRWHQILNMRSAAFRLGAVNSINLLLVVRGDLPGHAGKP